MYPFTYASEAYGFNPDGIPTEGAAYNAFVYNDNLYNAAILVLALNDTVSSTDSDSKTTEFAKVDIITLAESIVKVLNNDPFFDDVIPLDVVVTFLTSKIITGDFVSLSDLLAPVLHKNLPPETVTLIENLTHILDTAYYDIIFLDENFTKQITNKGLFDSVRINDWLSAKLDPASQWSD